MNTLKSFWSNVSTGDGPDACWVWTGGKHSQGYGRFNAGGIRWLAHRFSYTHFIGPIPDGLDVLHRCDNRPCVRPSHFFVGTQADNVRDAIAKGRVAMPGHWTGAISPLGVNHHNAHLNDEKVRTIMQLSRTTSQRELGRMFDVRHSTIWAIFTGKTWGHITGLKRR